MDTGKTGNGRKPSDRCARHRDRVYHADVQRGREKVLQFLTDGQQVEKIEESHMKDTKYELIVVIANHGHSEEVMDAARKEGAGGGTVIHAKGTGLERAEKFLGVSIADEKELILIVAKTEMKMRS